MVFSLMASLLLFILSFFAEANAQREYCIAKDTYGTYSKFDLDKLIQYSTDNEVTQIKKMLEQKKLVSLKKGMKVELVDNGFSKSVIRLPDDTEKVKIWILSDAVANCSDLK